MDTQKNGSHWVERGEDSNIEVVDRQAMKRTLKAEMKKKTSEYFGHTKTHKTPI